MVLSAGVKAARDEEISSPTQATKKVNDTCVRPRIEPEQKHLKISVSSEVVS